MEVIESVRQFFMQELKDNGFHEGIGNDDSLLESGVMDSLAVLLLISFFEENFGIIVDPEKVKPESFQTIRAVSQFIQDNRDP